MVISYEEARSRGAKAPFEPIDESLHLINSFVGPYHRNDEANPIASSKEYELDLRFFQEIPNDIRDRLTYSHMRTINDVCDVANADEIISIFNEDEVAIIIEMLKQHGFHVPTKLEDYAGYPLEMNSPISDELITALNTPIDDFDLSTRAKNVCEKSNIAVLRDLYPMNITWSCHVGEKIFGELMRICIDNFQKLKDMGYAPFDPLAIEYNDELRALLDMSISEIEMSNALKSVCEYNHIETIGHLYRARIYKPHTRTDAYAEAHRIKRAYEPKLKRLGYPNYIHLLDSHLYDIVSKNTADACSKTHLYTPRDLILTGRTEVERMLQNTYVIDELDGMMMQRKLEW